MGHRDDRLERLTPDERAEAALRRALALLDEPQLAEPPPDLVARSMRRLPNMTPAGAARVAQRLRAIRLAIRLGLLGLALLVLLLGLAGLAGGQLALLFGDGGAGLSRALLTLQLLAKPLWRAVGSVGVAGLVSAAAALVGGAALWWRLVRQAPVFVMEHAP